MMTAVKKLQSWKCRDPLNHVAGSARGILSSNRLVRQHGTGVRRKIATTRDGEVCSRKCPKACNFAIV